MFKVEIFKISHSLNLLFLSAVIIPVALFLGVAILQMDGNSSDGLWSIIFVSSSAVLMLYITILAVMLINRDYSSNNFRVLVGIGISRGKIVLAKFFIFIAVGMFIIGLHAVSALIVPSYVSGIHIDGNQIAAVFTYMIVYASIISIMFLLAVIGRTTIKSILLNIAFVMISSVSVALVGQFPNVSLIFPVQSLQFIASNTSDQYMPIVLISLLYMTISYALTYLVFAKQEL